MVSAHNMTKAITQTVIEATKSAVMAVLEAEGPAKSRRAGWKVPGARGPTMRQLNFDWNVQDKCNELNNFKIEVRNIFLMNTYSTKENKKVPIIMNWIACEEL